MGSEPQRPNARRLAWFTDDELHFELARGGSRVAAVTLEAPDDQRGMLIGPADKIGYVVRPTAVVAWAIRPSGEEPLGWPGDMDDVETVAG